MEHAFWHDKWQRNQIGFHEGDANALLAKHFDRLQLAPGARVFVPLCGKTADMVWLREQGVIVAGIELSPLAVSQFFDALDETPIITSFEHLTRYSVEGIEIFVGDIFDLSAHVLGHVDAVYDRAALVALPAPLREKYVAQVVNITQAAQQLVIVFDYDQQLRAGPPFAISADMLMRYYVHDFTAQQLCAGVEQQVAGVKMHETAWHLMPHLTRTIADD